MKQSNNPDIRMPHGLAAVLSDFSRIPLPLRAVDVRFEVVGNCAQVCLQQEFEYEGETATDVIYAFPLPSEAAVHECVMTIGERRVQAEVRPLAEARKTYNKARNDGKRAAVVESLRDNLFELSLGNVQPGDAIRIDFSYAIPLSGEDNSRELRIPVCPGVRYVPGKSIGGDGGTDLVPDAGRLARPRIDKEHPDAAVFYCAGKLASIDDLKCHSHQIEQIVSGDHVAVLISSEMEFPDRDFVLTWNDRGITQALASPGDSKHVLCSVSATDMDDHEPLEREILFLLDSSGSMHGENWQSLRDAMEIALDHLRPNDRFRILLFDNNLHDLTSGWKSASQTDRDQSFGMLRRHTPSGGTDFTEAFAVVVDESRDSVNRVVIVITDGQFGDEDEATRIAQDCDVEVHTFGIDANVNEGVLRKIARRTHGTCSLVSPGQELTDKVKRLMERLLGPSIRRFGAVGDWELIGHPSSLKAGQSTLIAYAYTGEGDLPETIVVEMEKADGTVIRQLFPVAEIQGEAASVLASKFEVEALIDEGHAHEAVQLACERNILAPGASFVAVDESEKVVVASAIIEQANLAPDSGQLFSSIVQPTSTAGPVGETLSCLMLESGIHTKPKAPRKEKSRSITKVTTHNSVRADLLELAEHVECFDQTEWNSLIEDVLFLWVAESPSHARQLLRALRDLIILGSGADVTQQGLDILRDLLSYVSEPYRSCLVSFIENESKKLLASKGGDSAGRTISPYLSKSDFKACFDCRTKLFYRKNDYLSILNDNEYLKFLADGGFMIETLAKARYPEGVDLSAMRDHDATFERTKELLSASENVVLFEAAAIHGKYLARIDILKRRGDTLYLIEVKSSSIDGSKAEQDGNEQSPICGRNGVAPKWKPYLMDVAYQAMILRQVFPEFKVIPMLCLVDKSKQASDAETLKNFRLKHDMDDPKSRPIVTYLGDIRDLQKSKLVIEIDVSKETALLYDEVVNRAEELSGLLISPGEVRRYQEDICQVYSQCKKCEYRFSEEKAPEQHGFAECWGELAHARPHILDLHRVSQIGNSRFADPVPNLLRQGKASILDLNEDQLGSAGAWQARRHLQWSHSGNDAAECLPSDLKNELSSHRANPGWPLHFLDFEACTVALPHHSGLQPYERVAFQWSCHTLNADGILTHHEWLNTQRDFPNFAFVSTLREHLGDTGTIYVWSSYEQSTLACVLRQIENWLTRDANEALRLSGLSNLEELKSLAHWIEELLGPEDPKGKSTNSPRIRDLHKLTLDHYFHPEMLGRTSIKVVLPAIWRQNETLRNHPWFSKYLKTEPNGQPMDPYKTLPELPLGDSDEEDDAVVDGTGAIRIYQDLIFRAEENSEFTSNREILLKQYCELDTAAMLMIWSHWNEFFVNQNKILIGNEQ